MYLNGGVKYVIEFDRYLSLNRDGGESDCINSEIDSLKNILCVLSLNSSYGSAFLVDLNATYI